MTLGLLIKRMRREDCDGLLPIEHTSDENYWSKEAFEKHIDSINCDILVASDPMGPVGFLAFERKLNYVQIWNIVVLPKFRLKGVGRLLVSRLQEMIPCEFDGIRFNVRETNLGAQLFLRRIGFWCDTIARSYFLDFTIRVSRQEDAYCFDFNPSVRRNKDVPIRIVSRSNAPPAGVCLGAGKRITSLYVFDGDGDC